jgi:protease I
MLMDIAPKDFMDGEFIKPKEIFQKKGMKVTVASTSTDIAHGMLGGTIKPDLKISNVKMENYDAIVIVGGLGSKRYLWENADLRILVKEAYGMDRVVSAICLSPVVLANADVLEGREATVYPDSEAMKVLSEKGVIYVDEPVVASRKIVTGRDPESAEEFSLRICDGLQ